MPLPETENDNTGGRRGRLVALLLLILGGVAVFVASRRDAAELATVDAPSSPHESLDSSHRVRQSTMPTEPVEDTDGVAEPAPQRMLAHGLVLRPNGTAVGGARIVFTDSARQATPAAIVISDGEGRFELRTSDVTTEEELGTVRSALSMRAETTSPRRESLPRLLLFENDASRSTHVLVLREAAVIRGRLVGVAGDAIADGEVLVLSFPSDAKPWEVDGSNGSRRVIRPGADGTFETTIASSHVRLFGRSTDGVFGRSVRLDVRGGDDVDAGSVVVGGAARRVSLVVRDLDGAPIEAAAVRLEPDDGVQRYTVGTGGDWVHYRTDAEGRVSFDVRASPSPLILGVGHLQFETVEVFVDRSDVLTRTAEVRLTPRPRIDVRVARPDGTPPPAELEIEVRSMTIGEPTDTAARRIGIGVAPDAEPARDGQISPADVLTRHLTSTQAEPSEGPGEFSLWPIEHGRYELSIVVGPGGANAVAEVEIDGQNLNPKVLHLLPPGRLVTLRATVSEEGVSNRTPWLVWATASGEYADNWPADSVAYQLARRTGHRVLTGPGSRRVVDTVVWIPWTANELFARDLTPPPAGRRGRHGSHPHASDDGSADPPGSDDDLLFGPPIRVAIPPGDDVLVDIPIPTDAGDDELTPVRINVVFGSEDALPVAGVEVSARRVGLPLRRRQATDRDGVARMTLPAGRYQLTLSHRVAPQEATTIDVPVEPTSEFEVTLDLAKRVW